MPSLRHLVATLALSAVPLLSGCSTDDPTSPTQQLRQLSVAESRWKAAGIRDYSFTVTAGCLCLPVVAGPLRVSVRDGGIVGVRYEPSAETLPVTSSRTVEELFALVRAEAAANPARLRVTYDAAYGFPASITYGEIERDAGAVITITRFTPGTGG